jgi:hypothetical protein
LTTPEGFRRIGTESLVRVGHEGSMAEWMAVAGAVKGPQDESSAKGEGRGPVARIALDDGGHAIVRHYRHGGALGGVLGDLYWQWPPRPWRELVATEAARGAGVLVPEVLGALVRPLGASGPAAWLYRGDLVTRELAGRRSLKAALVGASDAVERRAWLAAAVRAVLQLHAAGVSHPDLSVGNFLVGTDPDVPVAIIDFDRAVVQTQGVGEIGRRAAWRRLSRSVAKLDLPALGPRDVAAVVRATEVAA